MQRFSAPPPARLGARASGRDAYAELLHDTRKLGVDEQHARDAFLRRLGPERCEALFELEILLKGIVCFGNPRNHPGPRANPAASDAEFRPQLLVIAQGMRRVLQLAHRCLGSFDRPAPLQRDLAFADDDAAAPAERASPETELLQLRRALSSLADVADGLLGLDHIPFRLFFAMAGAVRREISRGSFFNPLCALEFRPEFDRIASPEILDLMRRTPSPDAQRLVALSFLTLLRMVRYLDVADAAGTQDGDDARELLALAVLRADARALSLHLRRRSGELLADCFERELLATPAHELEGRRDALMVSARKFIDLRGAFDGIVSNLRLELRRVFERQLPAVGAWPEPSARKAACDAVEALRHVIHADLVMLGRALGRNLEDATLFERQPARRERTTRLRQQVWMFAQIVRAFVVKAQHAHRDEDRWHAAAGVEFTREFLTYFHAIGYGLLRGADYGRLVVFEEAIAPVRRPDMLDSAKVSRAIAECEAVHEFLERMFIQLGARPELAGVAFDKRAAASALRTYLGD